MRKKGTKKAHFNYFQGIKDVLFIFFHFQEAYFLHVTLILMHEMPKIAPDFYLKIGFYKLCQ